MTTAPAVTKVLHTYDPVLARPGGGSYVARACGRETDGGRWEGWIEFLPDDGSPVLRSHRETTQPNLTDIEYWSTGLSEVYLEGALARALTPERPVHHPPEQRPAYDGPAPARPAPGLPATAILDPFSVAAKGHELLEKELSALDERHLRAIVRDYDLADERQVDLDAMGRGDLVTLISRAVAERRAVGA